MTTRPKQLDIETAIGKLAKLGPYAELADVTSGEFFKPKSRNHYEVNDGVPSAPAVELNRPTIRQRIENLMNRDPAVLQRYLQEGPPDGSEGIDMDVPDDPEASLTASEANYLDTIAADLAEQAPLPDEGLPRPSEPQSSEVPASGKPPEAAPAATAPAAAPAASQPVPVTR